MLASLRKSSPFIRTKSYRRRTSLTPEQIRPHLVVLAPSKFVFPDMLHPTSISISGMPFQKEKLASMQPITSQPNFVSEVQIWQNLATEPLLRTVLYCITSVQEFHRSGKTSGSSGGCPRLRYDLRVSHPLTPRRCPSRLGRGTTSGRLPEGEPRTTPHSPGGGGPGGGVSGGGGTTSAACVSGLTLAASPGG